jgi:hypothetical protein
VPPTFLFCLEMDGPNPARSATCWAGLPPSLLHGEQGFTYHRHGVCGRPLTFEQRIEDIYDKKGGALEFVVR